MADSFTAIAMESLLRALPEIPENGHLSGAAAMKGRASLDREQIESTPLRLTLTMTVGEWREIIGVLGPVTPTNASMRLYRTISEAIEHFDRTCNFEYEGEG